jgi:UPF0755 protein
MKRKLFIFCFLITLALGGIFLWWNQAIKPMSDSAIGTVKFTVAQGETGRDIAERLNKEGLIRSPLAFFLLARFGGKADNLQAGDFHLSPAMDLPAIFSNLSHGTSDVRVTIPEGWRNEEIAVKLTQEFGIPEAEFLKYAKEGYMFPDTYQLPKDASSEAVAAIMLKNFNEKVSSQDRQKAQSRGLTIDQLVTIASLVEREAKFDLDRPLVASVILNRMKQNMPLDLDATVQYAVGYQQKTKTWWKKELTIDDLHIVSPYNTYAHPGLPPAPIANPGLAAIHAVIEAPHTEYIFYISEPSGKTHFAKTLEEHNSNISKYLNK